MNKAIAIGRLCSMPAEFTTRGDVSMVNLIRDSGYIEVADQVFESEIEEYLREHSDLVDVWRQYSEDQRCSPAWYLSSPKFAARATDSRWRAGYYSTLPAERTESVFPDGYAACAYFVKR